MKKRILGITMAFLSSLSLLSCSSEKKYSEDNYFLKMNYKENFKILQLTDIHIGNKDDQETHFNFMDLTIKEASADLIVLSGDIFTFADKSTAKRLFNFMDSYNTPWTCTFGNHDEQCYFSVDWLTEYLNSLNDSSDSYCIFKDIQDDDVFGNANFVINLVDGSTVKKQIYIMDSNRYYFGSYYGYDFIKDSQISWYKRMVDYSTNNYSDGINPISSVMFFHIPLPEWSDAWDAYEKGDATLVIGERNEGIASPDYNSGFFDVLKNKNSTKAVMVGHDHLNDYTILYEGIYLSYGVNSTDRIYYQEDMIGGQTITLSADDIVFEHIFHSYEEVR